MKTAPSYQTQHKCTGCEMRGVGFFCDLKPRVLTVFESLKITNTYPKGATLFTEGEEANGVYMLCKGRVKLSAYSSDGKALILRIASAGDILGLSAAIGDTPHKAT